MTTDRVRHFVTSASWLPERGALPLRNRVLYEGGDGNKAAMAFVEAIRKPVKSAVDILMVGIRQDRAAGESIFHSVAASVD